MVRNILMLVLLLPSLAFAGHMPYVCHHDLSAWIKAGKSLSIVDIQDTEEFQEHHYEGSITAGNDPDRLKKIARRVRSAPGNVIVVSSTGGEDAVQAAELLALAGVPKARLLVLEGGMEAASKHTACDCCKPAPVKQVNQ